MKRREKHFLSDIIFTMRMSFGIIPMRYPLSTPDEFSVYFCCWRNAHTLIPRKSYAQRQKIFVQALMAVHFGVNRFVRFTLTARHNYTIVCVFIEHPNQFDSYREEKNVVFQLSSEIIHGKTYRNATKNATWQICNMTNVVVHKKENPSKSA